MATAEATEPALHRTVIWLTAEQLDKLEAEINARKQRDRRDLGRLVPHNRGTVIRELIDTKL